MTKLGLSINDPRALQGYTLLAPLDSSNTYLLDMEGKVVQTWASDCGPALCPLLLENGHLLRPGSIGSDSRVFGPHPGVGGRIQEFTWEGKLVWETPSHWSLDRMLTAGDKASAATQWINQYLSMSRPHVLWENSTVGTLSTDNSRVYAIEDLALPPINVQAYGNPWGTNPNLPFGSKINAAVPDSLS